MIAYKFACNHSMMAQLPLQGQQCIRNSSSYSCDQCDEVFKLKAHLKVHKQMHTGQEPSLYEYKSINNLTVVGRNKTLTVDKPYTCDLCAYICSSSKQFSTHKRAHTVRSFKCCYCDYISSRNSHVRRHAKSVHTPTIFSCEVCNYKCSTYELYVTHAQEHKSDREKWHSCDQCNYKGATVYHLVVHKRTHTKEKPFSCSQCTYKCSQLANLLAHERTHTGEKPYSCVQCFKQFVQLSHFIAHNRTHTGERPYVCDQCDYKSRQMSNLTVHKKLHHEQKSFDVPILKTLDNTYKLFSCGQCNYSCHEKESFFYHMEKHEENKSYFCRRCFFICNNDFEFCNHARKHMDTLSVKLFKLSGNTVSLIQKQSLNSTINQIQNNKLKFESKLMQEKISMDVTELIQEQKRICQMKAEKKTLQHPVKFYGHQMSTNPWFRTGQIIDAKSKIRNGNEESLENSELCDINSHFPTKIVSTVMPPSTLSVTPSSENIRPNLVNESLGPFENVVTSTITSEIPDIMKSGDNPFTVLLEENICNNSHEIENDEMLILNHGSIFWNFELTPEPLIRGKWISLESIISDLDSELNIPWKKCQLSQELT